MTDRIGTPRVPANVVVLLGASTAAYSLVLAGVAGLQSRGEAEIAVARAPAVRAIDQLDAGHDQLAARLDEASTGYEAMVQAYLAAGGRLDALDGQLAGLAAAVAQIDGVSRSLPTSVRMPQVRRSVTVVQAPTTQSTTGASGG
jgi:putative aminopeptidase FrvX